MTPIGLLRAAIAPDHPPNPEMPASKYPAMSVLPDAMPDNATCRRCIEIAERALGAARRLTKNL